MTKIVSNILSYILRLPVYFYRGFISPLLPPSCRHTPSCSQYALDALRRHGPFRGVLLATNRILRCRPGGTYGYDPVPLFVIKRYKKFSMHPSRYKRSNRLKERPKN